MTQASPMPCAEVARRLWEYLDSELDPDTTARVWDHLRQCQKCFPRYNFHRAFQRLLRRQDGAQAPPALRRRVFLALLREGMGDAPPDALDRTLPPDEC